MPARSILLLGALSVLLAGAGAAIGPGAFWAFTALALEMNLFATFFSDKLVLRMNGARELPRAEAPRLHAMVDELAGLARLFSTHPPAEERIRRLRALALETPIRHLVPGAATRRPQHS